MGDWIGWLAILAGGMAVTFQLTVATVVLTIAWSTIVAVSSVSPWRPLRVATRLYVDLFRSIPTLALLLFTYYGLGKYIAHLDVPTLALPVIGLTLAESANLSEIYRAGLEAIPKAQHDAAASLGLGWLRTIGLVILPQALVASIPATVNMVIFTIKDSSLASLIATPEVTGTASLLVSEVFQPLPVYILLALLYIAVIVPLTVVATPLEAFLDHRFGNVAAATRMGR